MRYLLLIYLVGFFAPPLWAQYRISGRIMDKANNPLPGANIVIKGTYKATYSDFEGNFDLGKLAAGNYQLQVTFIGYQSLVKDIALNQDTPLNLNLIEETLVADEIVVRSTRATEQTPIAFDNLEKADIQKQNFGQDLPLLLNFSPSVVTTSDAGAGVGYTGIRIRGSDPTRVNVTINGIPLNDAESQGTFWVNLPDFASTVESIQIQRGVGTSTNGAGAFGASINIQTNQLNREAYAEINNSYGSFDTWKHTLVLGTGLIKDKFTLDGRLSKISSDGFIDRAFSDLRSFYLSGAYYGKKSLIRANVFTGKETTFQAWYGVPEARLRGDVPGMQAFAARNFLNEAQTQNLLQSDSRRYNSQLYDDETDNYQQDHYQLFYTYDFGSHLDMNVGLHYTRGRGYFEQLRENDLLSDYGLEQVIIGGDTVNNSDIIRRLWLDNDFYGAIFSFNYRKNRLDLKVGGAWNRYEGLHFGEIIWAEFASNSEIRDRYYENDAEKSDFNIYGKILYQLNSQLSAFLDLQYRRVDYSFLGLAVDDALGSRPLQQSSTLHFFNPKIGLNYRINSSHMLYTSLSLGNKEPNRNDFVQSSPQSRPQSERLYDIEAGYRFQSSQIAFGLNAYAMLYDDQLVVTGAVNDVGAFNRQNVDQSYRIGLEFEFAWKPIAQVQWDFNTTLSQNKIQDFVEVVDFFGSGEDLAVLQEQGFVLNEQSGQLERNLGNTDIAFSPNLTLASQLSYTPVNHLTISLLSKYVGQQFLDNTSSEESALDAFFTNDIRIRYQIRPSFMKEINLSLLVNNIFDVEYEPNGYTFGYFLGQERIRENFFFPQAGIHFLLALGLRF